ncbi:MAG: beta-lactamase family protein [Rhizobiales bacterium]|nr:beta-lactamase family protein [Hyphomicrobiales bacterium]MBN9010277.1 beta-lactamase family protein [Hyphomicrobiales bacterium]
MAAFVLAAGGMASAQPALKPIDPAALQETLDELAAEMMVPGAAMLLRTPDGEFVATYGFRGLDDRTPVTIDDHIRIGSNTKTWTGTVILQMVQEGKIALADPVSKYRPDVPNGDNITIEQLLDMRSGLFNYSTTFVLNDTLDREPLRVWKPDELLSIAYAVPPYFPPGQGYHYSNTNTVLLGLIAEKIDGKPLETIFEDRLFAPLGLKETLLPARTSNAMPAPHPRGYMYTDNVLTLATNAIPPDLQVAARNGTLRPNDQTDVNPSWGWAAGAGISTARDLATWVEAMTGGKILGPELQKIRMASLRPQKEGDAGGALYGLGIAQFGPLYGHTGELPGFNTFMGSDPVNKVTLVVWTNLAPAADGRDPATTIARALLGHVYAGAL